MSELVEMNFYIITHNVPMEAAYSKQSFSILLQNLPSDKQIAYMELMDFWSNKGHMDLTVLRGTIILFSADEKWADCISKLLKEAGHPHAIVHCIHGYLHEDDILSAFQQLRSILWREQG